MEHRHDQTRREKLLKWNCVDHKERSEIESDLGVRRAGGNRVELLVIEVYLERWTTYIEREKILQF